MPPYREVKAKFSCIDVVLIVGILKYRNCKVVARIGEYSEMHEKEKDHSRTVESLMTWILISDHFNINKFHDFQRANVN